MVALENFEMVVFQLYVCVYLYSNFANKNNWFNSSQNGANLN